MKGNRDKIITAAILLIVIVSLAAAGYFIGKGSEGRYLSESPGGTAEDSDISDGNGQENNEDAGNDGQDPGNGQPEEKAEEEPVKELKPVEKYKDFKAKAIYYTGTSAGSQERIDNLIRLAKETELNAVVIDIKEGGVVNYESSVPQVKENNLFVKYYDPIELIKKLHENDIYVIGRIVCFRDDGLARKRADLAIKRPDGTLWREGSMGSWTNPYNEEVWKYNIDIAKEAADLGFDEIQFDYVRFPTPARKSDVYYGENMPPKTEAINGFLKAAKEELHDGKGVFVSADVFGIIIESKVDGDAIGQDFEKVGLDVDYICPMIYPSHYANASRGIMGNGYGQEINGVLFTKPDLQPYEVVFNTLTKAKERISGMEGYYAKVRPYIQDFTASYLEEGYYQVYGAEQVRQQIDAVYDAGFEEWILWDGYNTYSEDALEKEPGIN